MDDGALTLVYAVLYAEMEALWYIWTLGTFDFKLHLQAYQNSFDAQETLFWKNKMQPINILEGDEEYEPQMVESVQLATAEVKRKIYNCRPTKYPSFIQAPNMKKALEPPQVANMNDFVQVKTWFEACQSERSSISTHFLLKSPLQSDACGLICSLGWKRPQW